MAGFGQALGNLARGLVSGAAGYYGAVAHQQEADSAEKGVLLREQALADYRSRIANQDADVASNRAVAQAKAETPILVDREDQTLAAREPYAARQAVRTEQLRLAGEDHTAAIQHGYRMIEADAAQSRNVVHNYTNGDGHPVVVYGDGHERILTGTVRPEASQDPQAVVDRYVNSDGHPVLVLRNNTEQVLTGTVRETGAGAGPPHLTRPGAPAAAASTVPAPAAARRVTNSPALAADRSRLATVYPNATPERYPGLFRNGVKIPLAEAQRMLEDAHSGD